MSVYVKRVSKHLNCHLPERLLSILNNFNKFTNIPKSRLMITKLGVKVQNATKTEATLPKVVPLKTSQHLLLSSIV